MPTLHASLLLHDADCTVLTVCPRHVCDVTAALPGRLREHIRAAALCRLAIALRMRRCALQRALQDGYAAARWRAALFGAGPSHAAGGITRFAGPRSSRRGIATGRGRLS